MHYDKEVGWESCAASSRVQNTTLVTTLQLACFDGWFESCG